MTFDTFLSFWDQHNTVIIEGLVALVLILSLFLAYRSFFGKKSSEGGSDLGHGLDAAQLEKTLQKILDNQAQSGKPAARNGGGASEDFGVDVDLDEMEKSSASTPKAASAAGESAAEVSQLRLSLTESHQKIETLQKQLKEALTAAEEAAASGGAPSAGAFEGGANSAANDELAGKVRDLEARLAEYEIISEDIADLSRYREENDQLKKELEALKAGGAKPAAAATAPVPEAPKVEAAPEPEPEPAPTPEVAAAPAEEPAPVAAETPAQEPSSDLIDDELMREFAAAVEGQKALDKAAEKAGDGSETAKAGSDESDKLMSEFENFVSKKS